MQNIGLSLFSPSFHFIFIFVIFSKIFASIIVSGFPILSFLEIVEIMKQTRLNLSYRFFYRLIIRTHQFVKSESKRNEK